MTDSKANNTDTITNGAHIMNESKNKDNNESKNAEQQTTGIDRRLEGDIIVNNKVTPYSDVIDSFQDMTILPKEIVDATVDMDWLKPSKIQATALPLLLTQQKNLIAQAHHGSGKTGTFVIAMLSVIDFDIKKLQGLILCHSRELALQTVNVIGNLGAYYAELSHYTAIPGKEVPSPWNAQICVGTPGTLLYKVITNNKNLKSFLSDFKILIIDEADEFLKRNATKNVRMNKFGKVIPQRSLCDQMLDIYDRINKYAPNTFQKLLFSATFPKKVKQLAAKIAQPNAVFIELKKSEVGLANIKLFKINCEGNNNDNINNINNINTNTNGIKTEMNKFNTLCTLISIGKVGQSIVFVNTIEKAKELIKNLQNREFKCSALYGRDMKPIIRDQTMLQFREGKTICLIASNVIARGIDVPTVNLVVNYEIPFELKSININNNDNKKGLLFDSETFMHRVGRCGRFGAKGVCVNLVDNKRDANNLGYILKDFSLKCHDLSMNINDIRSSLMSWLNIEDNN